MEFNVHIQDPSNPETVYLYEALVAEFGAEELVSCRGMFAFATRAAVDNLLVEDPTVSAFLTQGKTDLLVGIDAVTDHRALEQLRELDQSIEGFRARAYFNPLRTLFHPKLVHFSRSDGTETLVVGSGNFTPGGLRENVEAFSVVYGTSDEVRGSSAWQSFWDAHRTDIREIDEEAIAIGRKNSAAMRSRPRRPVTRPESEGEEEAAQAANVAAISVSGPSRVLAAEVPSGGGRWSQIHYNKDVIEIFFRAQPNSSDRIFLQPVAADGTVGAEEVHPLVFSTVNRNYKVEARMHHGEPYPGNATPPLIVLREVGVRNFAYTLLMPFEQGYNAVRQLIADHPRVGRGTKRVLVDSDVLERYWPDSPLLPSAGEEVHAG